MCSRTNIEKEKYFILSYFLKCIIFKCSVLVCHFCSTRYCFQYRRYSISIFGRYVYLSVCLLTVCNVSFFISTDNSLFLYPLLEITFPSNLFHFTFYFSFLFFPFLFVYVLAFNNISKNHFYCTQGSNFECDRNF